MLPRCGEPQSLAQAALGFVQLADVLEHLACGGRWLALRRFVLRLTQQLTQMLGIGIGVLTDKVVQHFIAARQQQVAPALKGMESLVVLTGRGVQLVDQRGNRLDVGGTHQFADVLDMAFARDVRLVFRRIVQRLAQSIAERQLGQQLRLEGGQALAQILQRLQLALDLGFALLAREVIVIHFRHGAGPVGNAAMITSQGRLVRPGRAAVSGTE